jgi:hypothetical protein
MFYDSIFLLNLHKCLWGEELGILFFGSLRLLSCRNSFKSYLDFLQKKKQPYFYTRHCFKWGLAYFSIGL